MTDQGTLIQNMLAQYGINNNNNNNTVSQQKRVNFAFSNTTDDYQRVSRTQIIQSLLDTAKNSNQPQRRSTRSRFNFDDDNDYHYVNPDSTTSSTGSSSIASIVTNEMINGRVNNSFRKKDNDANPENSFFNQPPAKISKVFTAPQKSIFDQLKRTKSTININSTDKTTTKLDLGFDFNSFLSNKRHKINQPRKESLKKQKIQNPTKSHQIKKKLSKEQEIVASAVKQKKLTSVEAKKQKNKIKKDSDNNIIKDNNPSDDDGFDFIDEMFESKPSNDNDKNTNKKRKADKMSNTTKPEKMEDDEPTKNTPKKTTTTVSSIKGRRKATSTTTKRRSRTRIASANKKK